MGDYRIAALRASFVSGLIMRGPSMVAVFFTIRGSNEWTVEIDNTVFLIQFVIGVALYIFTGLRSFIGLTRKEIFNSCIAVSAFYLIIVVLQMLFSQIGSIPSVIGWISLPIDVYSIWALLAMRITGLNPIICNVVGILSPLAFALFPNKNGTNKKTTKEEVI